LDMVRQGIRASSVVVTKEIPSTPMDPIKTNQ